MGDIQFNGTPEEWDALVKKNKKKEEPKKDEDDKFFIDSVFNKKETLEEAAERYWVKQPYNEDAFIEGAKWQQDHQNEYVIAMIAKYIEDMLDPQTHGNIESVKEWFEQFKKK
jgi:hypothetical protein